MKKKFAFLSFWFQTVLAQNKNNERLKKLFQLQKTRVCCPHFLFLPEWQKAKRMNKKTEGPVQLLFCLVPVSYSKMLLFHCLFTKKNNLSVGLYFLVNEKYKEKKLSYLCTKQLLGCLFKKRKGSAGLLLFLDLFWKKGKDKVAFFFFGFA